MELQLGLQAGPVHQLVLHRLVVEFPHHIRHADGQRPEPAVELGALSLAYQPYRGTGTTSLQRPVYSTFLRLGVPALS